MFGGQCCIYIPNNTAQEGAFNEVLIKLKRLRRVDKETVGKDNKM